MKEKKTYIDANTLLLDSFKLARKIWEDEYVPDYLIALWRGGTPVGIAIHEFFRFKGHEPYHTAIKTQSYTGFTSSGKVDVKGIEHVLELVKAGDRMLLVDDVFDTGSTIREVQRIIRAKARSNAPEIRVATVYYKPRRNEGEKCPDYFLRAIDGWIVFPHELDGLSSEEHMEKGDKLYRVIYEK